MFDSGFQQGITTLGGLARVFAGSGREFGWWTSFPRRETLDLPDYIMDSVLDAYQKPLQTICIVLACFLGLALLMSLFIKGLALEKEEVGRQGFRPPSRRGFSGGDGAGVWEEGGGDDGDAE